MKKKYLILNSLIFLNFISCFCQIVNEGVLQIAPSTDVYFENEYTNKALGIHNNHGNLYLNHNFINDGSTVSLSGTTSFKSSTNPLINISGTSNVVNFYNLEIDITAVSTKGVAVADNFELNVSNAINFVSGDVRLIGESQLVQTNLGASVNTVTSGKLLIDQQGYSSPYKFNYWSSPVNNGGFFSLLGSKFDGTDSSLNPFTPVQILFNSGSPFNGVPSVVDGGSNVTTALTINDQWLFKYLRGTGLYSDWVNIDQNSTLNPGEGYTMKGTNTISSDQNYVFYGLPNNGEYQLLISNGEQSLLGNPYPSSLDANKFISDNILIFDSLHFWVDGGSTSHVLSNYLGGYAIRNLTGGTPPSIPLALISGIGSSGSITPPKQYIPVGQGFFVQAYGTGSIVFNNSQRVYKPESSGDAIFYRNSDTNNANNQYIRIGHEDPEGFHRQILLGFLPNTNADASYNPGYDAIITETREDDLFFVIENDLDKKYAIQGVNSFEETMEYPLGIKIGESGTHRIMLDKIENFEHTIYLKDNYLNTTHNLNESSFEFNLPVGEYFDRYSIVFIPQEVLSIDDNQTLSITIFYDGNKNVVVNNIDRVQIKSIKIIDVLGQEVLKLDNNLNNQSRVLIPFDKSDGVYNVKIETLNSYRNQKILKY